MAAYQYVYHMEGVSKAYPGGKKCFENIHLNFLPGVKIGVVGVNGSGKSTLMRIMAGIDTDFQGEAWAAKGARVGYLPQEPNLDESLDVRGNVMLGVAPKKAILDRYNELAMNYSDETAEEMVEPAGPDRRRRTSGTSTARSTSRWRPSAARPTTPMSPPSRAANNAASRSANCCSKRPTCCCSTNPPTTSTPKPSPGCNST